MSKPKGDPVDVANRRALMAQLIAQRKQANLSQRELARRMGIDSSGLCEFEWMSAAGINDPRLSTLQRYARALGIPYLVIPTTSWPGLTEVIPTSWPGLTEVDEPQ